MSHLKFNQILRTRRQVPQSFTPRQIVALHFFFNDVIRHKWAGKLPYQPDRLSLEAGAKKFTKLFEALCREASGDEAASNEKVAP